MLARVKIMSEIKIFCQFTVARKESSSLRQKGLSSIYAFYHIPTETERGV